jgi:hypothetical protein
MNERCASASERHWRLVAWYLNRAGPTFVARYVLLSALANHARDRWHQEVAEDDRIRLKRALLAQAAVLGGPGASEAVRSTVVISLIGQARDAGLFCEEELLHTAGYKPPWRFWESLLSQPMALTTLARSLARFLSDPTERPSEFDSRSAAQRRIEHAWDNWIRAGWLEEPPVGSVKGRRWQTEQGEALELLLAPQRDSSGRRFLRDPRLAVELLARSPATSDLVTVTLRTFLNQTANVGSAESTVPAVKEEMAPPRPKTAAPRQTKRTPRPEIRAWLLSKYEQITPKPGIDKVWKAASSKDAFGDKVTFRAVRDEYRDLWPETGRSGPRVT